MGRKEGRKGDWRGSEGVSFFSGGGGGGGLVLDFYWLESGLSDIHAEGTASVPSGCSRIFRRNILPCILPWINLLQ